MSHFHERADLALSHPQYSESLIDAVEPEAQIRQEDILQIMNGTAKRIADFKKSSQSVFEEVAAKFTSLQTRVFAILQQGAPGPKIAAALHELAIHADGLAVADMEPVIVRDRILAATKGLKAVSKGRAFKSEDVSVLIRSAIAHLAPVNGHSSSTAHHDF